MKKARIEFDVKINGKEVRAGHMFLERIVYSIPDIQDNEKILFELAKSDNPDIRETLAATFSSLNNDTLDLLLEDENEDIVHAVLRNEALAKRIKHHQLMHLIDTDKIKYLTTIAANLKDFKLCDPCEVIKRLYIHQNSVVRFQLLIGYSSDLISSPLLEEMSHDVDIDIVIRAKKELDNRQNKSSALIDF